jgi:hypothetical protein
VIAGVPERLGRSLLLPLYSDGPTWDHGGSHRPALDRVAAVLFVLGAALTAVGWVVRRRIEELLILAAVPLLMLPAVLARLQPELAPSPLRCGGAIGPVFVLAGIGLASVVGAISTSLKSPTGRRVALAAATLLVGLSAIAGRAVVHGPFADTWDGRAWNSSELGEVVRSGLSLGIPLDNSRVVPYPHWVDTRLVAVEAGFPGRDLAIDPEQIRQEFRIDGPRLYLLHPEDRRTLNALQERLPGATTVGFSSRVPGKAFLAVIDVSGAGGD